VERPAQQARSACEQWNLVLECCIECKSLRSQVKALHISHRTFVAQLLASEDDCSQLRSVTQIRFQ